MQCCVLFFPCMSGCISRCDWEGVDTATATVDPTAYKRVYSLPSSRHDPPACPLRRGNEADTPPRERWAGSPSPLAAVCSGPPPGSGTRFAPPRAERFMRAGARRRCVFSFSPQPPSSALPSIPLDSCSPRSPQALEDLKSLYK